MNNRRWKNYILQLFWFYQTNDLIYLRHKIGKKTHEQFDVEHQYCILIFLQTLKIKCAYNNFGKYYDENCSFALANL